MIDLYLKFADEAQAKSVLYTETPATLDDDGVTVSEALFKPNYANIDVLGVIYDMADAENHVALDGWHVNVRLVDGEDGSALEPFAVIPTQPRRVWA